MRIGDVVEEDEEEKHCAVWCSTRPLSPRLPPSLLQLSFANLSILSILRTLPPQPKPSRPSDQPMTLPLQPNYPSSTQQHTTPAKARMSTIPTSTMALSNVGSLVLNLLIFITTLVNFSYALTTLEPLLLLALYAISKIFVVAPEQGILAKCQHKHLYQEG